MPLPAMHKTERAVAVASSELVGQRRSRHERKMARNEAFARQAAIREQWERAHPILSGKVKIVDYVPPGNGTLPNAKLTDGGCVKKP
jgi:hypothetical protein